VPNDRCGVALGVALPMAGCGEEHGKGGRADALFAPLAVGLGGWRGGGGDGERDDLELASSGARPATTAAAAGAGSPRGGGGDFGVGWPTMAVRWHRIATCAAQRGESGVCTFTD
jgi:hypothetical protein